MTPTAAWGPLAALLAPDELADWMWTGAAEAVDTGVVVHCYQHAWTGRCLRLDRHGRTYRQDGRGVRLLGDGGPCALLAAVLVVFAGCDQHLPRQLRLPEAPSGPLDAVPEMAGALALAEAELWRVVERQG